MTIEIESDATRLAMLRAVGGVTATGPRSTLVGVFDRAYIGVGGDVPVDSVAPQFLARSSDIESAGISDGSTLHIEGRTYVVRSLQPDGTGMTSLVLEE